MGFQSPDHIYIVTCDSYVPCGFVLGDRLFFEVCDGIYLDYGWNESSLEQSKRLSAELGRMHDVYVGVDVFGRFGNGGFNTVEVLTFCQVSHLCSLKRVLG